MPFFARRSVTGHQSALRQIKQEAYETWYRGGPHFGVIVHCTREMTAQERIANVRDGVNESLQRELVALRIQINACLAHSGQPWA